MATADEETLSEVFWAVAGQLRHLAHETFAPLGITPGQSRAMRVLSRHGEMRLNALSEHLRIAPRSTTEVVDALQERGLVTRTPDPDDRRATLVQLTPEGREAFEAVRTARHSEAEAFFGRLSDADRTDLARILGTLTQTPTEPPTPGDHARPRGGSA